VQFHGVLLALKGSQMSLPVSAAIVLGFSPKTRNDIASIDF